eukprot:6199512-Pleurochrysis_carterae.AAC.2
MDRLRAVAAVPLAVVVRFALDWPFVVHSAGLGDPRVSRMAGALMIDVSKGRNAHVEDEE